jgi:hypothetical protein
VIDGLAFERRERCDDRQPDAGKIDGHANLGGNVVNETFRRRAPDRGDEAGARPERIPVRLFA